MRFSTWASVALAPVVAVLAFLAVGHFNTRADEARRSQVAYTRLEAEANLASSLQWRAVVAHEGDQEILEQRAMVRVRILAALRTLRVIDAKNEHLPLVAQLIRSYEAGFDAELKLIRQGRVDEARALDEQVLDPALARLSELLREVNKEQAAAASTEIRRATLGTGASLTAAVLLLLLLFWRFHHDRRKLLLARTQELYEQALQDSLTGLPNRRKLMLDLERTLEETGPANPQRLVMFDLDGFKNYNDTFGHPEGDLLLRRLGKRFAAAVDGRGTAYRLGGDEFCALIPDASAEADQIIRDCCEALAEDGRAFTVQASFGTASIPAEAATASEALRLSDQRMYADKRNGRLSARQQTLNLVLKVLAVQQPGLREHVRGVAALARAVGERFGLDQGPLEEIERVAELHDLGKLAIPDSILTKKGPLDEDEWQFMRRHTLIGETILQAAPALASIAKLVRSTHERFDGAGYPDGLVGQEIPLASRIVFVCDAYEAMTSDRSYRSRMDETSALEELRRHAGTQFDPAVVEAFCDALEATRGHRDGTIQAA